MVRRLVTIGLVSHANDERLWLTDRGKALVEGLIRSRAVEGHVLTSNDLAHLDKEHADYVARLRALGMEEYV